MEPIINLEETIGKTVGRLRPVRSALDVRHSTKANARAWRKLIDRPYVPRGVFRFNSHEDADAWLMKMMTRR